ncbi:MAG TPA: hypothetical protein VNF02_01165 [Candidatus Limnocylindrales bacterium]|nr:hypothetical protein [Candidatus Limnocylindrales bacterium]
MRVASRVRLFISLAALLICALAADVPAAAQTLGKDSLAGMKWRLVGPFRGGRAEAVAGVAGNPSVFYFGAVAGGVWKTTDAGLTWKPLFQHQAVSSIGAIAVDPQDPNVIYVGTGEEALRGDISYGDGMYKSVDGGATWTHIGLDDTRHIAKILIDPHDPNIIFVAAIGHACGPNAERGVFRSTDAGKTWQKVLYKDDKTGAVDLTFAVQNSHVLYAAMYQELRTPWGFTSGGPGSGIYKSVDGGTTWKQLKGHGLPDGVLGRIGIAVGADQERVYALIEAKKGGLYRSDDAGASWHFVTGDHRFRQRAWYFTNIYTDPKNTDTLYILNTGMYRSTDGGKTFQTIPAPHGDRHDLWIDPTDTSRMIEADDGGATISEDNGRTWSTENNQPTAEFYHVATDDRFNYYIYGAQQDNSTVAIASRSDSGAIIDKDWYDVGGGESGFVVPNPKNPNIVYAGSYDGLITRYDKADGQEQDISAWPLNPMGWAPATLKYRFQWTAPIMMSPFDSNTIYHGAQVLFKSTDQGQNWTVISPDLTRNDKSKQVSSGGPITQDNTSVEYYDTIFAVAESPLARGLIWVGSDDGLVHLTRNGGKSWSDVTPKNLPGWSRIDTIEPSPHAAGTAYLAADRSRWDDYHPYLYKTNDYGKTWTKITNGLPDNVFTHVIREDIKRKGLLFAGTETGIYVSFDDGAQWQSLQLNLPTVPVHDMTIHGNDLIVATHGRAFWSLDDITPLRQMNSTDTSAAAYLFKPETAYRFGGGHFRIPPGFAAGENPPSGAVIDYSLSTAPKDPITLEILDAKGKVIRKYSSKKKAAARPGGFSFFGGEPAKLPAKAGLNRFAWDLRYAPPSIVPGAVSWGGRPVGPLAVPGNYQVKLTVAGTSYTEPLKLDEDPRIQVSAADLQKQLDFSLQIRDRITQAHDTVNQIREIHGQLTALEKRLAGNPKSKATADEAKDLDKKFTAVEDALIQVKSKSGEDPLNFPIMIADQLMALDGTVESADTAPTQSSRVVFDLLSKQLDTQLATYRQLKDKDLADFNKKVRSEDVPAISVSSPSGDAGESASK